MKVLVPIDGDLESRQAIPVALRDADQLILATIGEKPETSEHRDDTLRALKQRLSEAASDIGTTSIPISTRVELAGDPVQGILDIAREERVDRIVIASDEPNALQQLVDGSVAEDLKDETSKIEVVVVPRR